MERLIKGVVGNIVSINRKRKFSAIKKIKKNNTKNDKIIIIAQSYRIIVSVMKK